MEKCTEKIDIYSLSMMMWEMLTSKLPWDGSNFQDVRQAVAHLGERPPIPADTPLQLADLLRDCWHMDPEQRPSAAAVLQRIAQMGVR
uniref:Protein kinase domain-containing protein n=1 Tax=Guillardia theta (strain CCMP2712) TaxID=905079 RepID=A0A0C3SMI5_GUITC